MSGKPTAHDLHRLGDAYYQASKGSDLVAFQAAEELLVDAINSAARPARLAYETRATLLGRTYPLNPPAIRDH